MEIVQVMMIQQLWLASEALMVKVIYSLAIRKVETQMKTLIATSACQLHMGTFLGLPNIALHILLIF